MRFLLLFLIVTNFYAVNPVYNRFIDAVNVHTIPGVKVVDKFGKVPEVTIDTDPLDIWEGQSEYIFSADGVNDINSLSSSSASDTVTISVLGQTDDGTELTQLVSLQGTTRVTIPIPLWRVYRMFNTSSVDIVGTVYCYAGTDNTAGVPSGSSIEKARIRNGNNQTLMAIYTIPKGKVGFLFRGEVGIAKEGNAGSAVEFATLQYKSRRYGKVFRVKKDLSLMPSGSSLFQDYRSFPDVIPALTDLKIHVDEVSDTMGLWSTFDILLYDENKFTDQFLKAIEQPGY